MEGKFYDNVWFEKGFDTAIKRSPLQCTAQERVQYSNQGKKKKNVYYNVRLKKESTVNSELAPLYSDPRSEAVRLERHQAVVTYSRRNTGKFDRVQA